MDIGILGILGRRLRGLRRKAELSKRRKKGRIRIRKMRKTNKSR